MAMGVCGWICAFLCCILCSGFVCFLIFGGTLTLGIFALASAVANCEGAELARAEACIPIFGKLGNATVNFEPRFDNAKELDEMIRLCGEATRCMSNVTCLTYNVKLRALDHHCDVFTFIKEEFQSCVPKLKKKAENVDCLKFLFSEDKCDEWLAHQKCIERHVEAECGLKMMKSFDKISKTFMKGACVGTKASRRF